MLPGPFEQGYLEGFEQCYMDSRNIDKYVVWLILMFTIQLTSQWINDNLDSSVKLSPYAQCLKILHSLSPLGSDRHYQSEGEIVVIIHCTLMCFPIHHHLPLNCRNYIPHAHGFISVLGIDNPIR